MAIESFSAVNRIGTEAAALNPTQISRNVQETFVREFPWLSGDLCSVEDFTLPGTTWQEAQFPSVTMSQALDTTSGAGHGDKTTAATMTSVQLTAYLYAVDLVFSKVALEAVQGDLQRLATNAGMRAATNIVDSTMCSKYTEAPSSSPDHEIGTAGTPYDYALYLAALELLGTQQAPGPYTQVLTMNQLSEALSVPEFIEAQIFGRGTIEKGYNVSNGMIGYSTENCRFFVSNNGVTSGGNRGFMFSQQGLGLRMKQGFKASVDASRLDISPRVLIIGFEIWFAAGGLRDSAGSNRYVVETLT